MSRETSDALDAAIREHVREETGGDIVAGWVMCAGIVEHATDSKTSWLSTRGLAGYEAKGLMSEGVELLAVRNVAGRDE